MSSKETILITGANGQVGSEFRVLSKNYPQYNFLFVGKDELSIGDIDTVKKYFAIHTIDHCINCAAYTAVDKAETESEKAFLINADAVGNLAAVCKTQNTRLIHISTDYVFDGAATTPYLESHPVNPMGVYGASKLQGEQLAFQNNPDTIVIRTSWVYSSFGNNFVKTMLRLMKERESINVVNDQQGCPTYAADLANVIMQIIIHHPLSISNSGNRIFNYSNAGSINWYQFAVAIKELTNSKCIVNPIPSAQYPTPAKRPQYSVLDTTKIRETFAISIPAWKDSLQVCLALLQ
ncbi:MAG TPA: dTDP-4-dehydrorhamnose reductase [Ferruginibacter sp.]|jgi:dTDP-4-dehydrorhamnose reductase|nr:dTDP-4-dehydrorhamnose reductase [Ferruginibacter sp.]